MADNYIFVTIFFLFLSMLVLRQKMKMDLKKESFELERSIMKDKRLMKNKRSRLTDMVYKHVQK